VAAALVVATATTLIGARPASADTASQIVSIAQANLGKTACSTNSAGGTGYYTSCTGNNGQPEEYCSDFAKWAWAQAGVDVTGLTTAAGSFAQYGPLQSAPHVGDAVLFDYNPDTGYAAHVAIVTAVNPDGSIESIGGDEPNSNGTYNPATIDQDGPYSGSLGGQTVSGFVSPHGDPSTPAPSAGSSLSGQDPYATGCANDEIVAGTSPIDDQDGAQVGTLDLMWSNNCQTNWGIAYFNDGNPNDGSTVDIKVVGSATGGGYTQGPVDAAYDGVGQPVWGNMIDSPGCAYATVTRANADQSIDMTGLAVQNGCPAPAGP
jgi:surface antigen